MDPTDYVAVQSFVKFLAGVREKRPEDAESLKELEASILWVCGHTRRLPGGSR